MIDKISRSILCYSSGKGLKKTGASQTELSQLLCSSAMSSLDGGYDPKFQIHSNGCLQHLTVIKRKSVILNQ